MQRVLGIGLDGTTISITLGRTVVPCTKGSYGDSLDPQFLTAMGSQAQDECTPGTYKTDDAKFTMSMVVYRTVFMPALAKNGAGNVRFNIVVGFEQPDLGDDSDLLENCTVKGAGGAIENSSKPLEVEVTFRVQQIRWTDARTTWNRLPGVVQGAATL